MTDISRRRRLLGRLLFGAAAVAVPLTASVSYAQAEPPAVEQVDVAPSAVAPPAPPAPLAPPPPPEAPDAPDAPEATDRQMRTFKFRGGEMSEEQRKRFEEMAREFEGRDWSEFAKKHADMAANMAEMEKHMPIIEERCEGEDSMTRTWTDDEGRRHVTICQRAIERHAALASRQAEFALRRAAFGLRQAREAIAGNSEMDAEVRDEIVRELDAEIERIEREQADS